MRAGLVVPCYIDVFYPEVGIAALELLEKRGVEVEYPFNQTCCGEPMANSGCESDSRATEELFIRNFAAFEYIVVPSGSCTYHVRNKFIAAPPGPEREHVWSHAYDIVEFLHDVVQVKEFPWTEFQHKVALPTGCSAIRGLFMQSMSERVHDQKFSKPRDLLQSIKGIEVTNLAGMLTRARNAGLTVWLLQANQREAAIAQFPGGYIAEIHSVVKK